MVNDMIGEMKIGGQTSRERGWWYPWIFVVFMGIVVIVNLVLLFFAVSTFSGLETEDAFQKGVTYNEAIRGARAQKVLGWTMAFAFKPDKGAQRQGKLSVSAIDRYGKALDNLKIKAMLVRPTREGFDAAVDMRPQGNGKYMATVVLPLPGRWDVRIYAWRANGAKGDSFQMRQEIMVP